MSLPWGNNMPTSHIKQPAFTRTQSSCNPWWRSCNSITLHFVRATRAYRRDQRRETGFRRFSPPQMKFLTLDHIKESVNSRNIIKFSIGIRWIMNCYLGRDQYLREPFPVPITSLLMFCRKCKLVYRLPSNAVVIIPLKWGLKFSILAWSKFALDPEVKGLMWCTESSENSVNTEISFPVWLFQICTVPSQEATLSEDARRHISFTTWQVNG